jgi:hypothetical protein
MNPQPDPLRKTTRIPFKFIGGRFVHFDDGTEINELVEGCIGDIVIENFKIKDAARIADYNAGVEVDFLPEGTKLLARVNPTHVPDDLQKHLVGEGGLIGSGRVEIILENDLRLQLRGTKTAKLLDCKCAVPALAEMKGTIKPPLSVNQALTRISEKFEPHRVGFGGNVFNLVYYEDPKLGWQPLSTLRDRRQIEHERQRSAPTR